jgi:hypothetical protein
MVPCVLKGALSHDCISQTVAAIEQARRSEGVRRTKLILPRNYASLTRAERTLVVINLERVARGLRPMKGMVKRLNKAAKTAAVAQTDPTPGMSLLSGLGVRRYQVLWANDYGVLASDWEWMYNDGFLGNLTTNVGCLFKGASDCWAHRKGILQPFTGLPLLIAGTGSARAGAGASSVTAILTGGYGKKPHFTYTWRNALRHGANGHRTR